MKILNFHRVSMGCDPEFFFTRNGKVVGSEKLLPANGFEVTPNGNDSPFGSFMATAFSTPKIIIDGVQGELNPRPHSCRETLANEISWLLNHLAHDVLKAGDSVDFSRAVEVSDEEMETLSERSKTFGCSPSRNIHSVDGASHIDVNPLVYRTRAAGGHIHLGPDTHGTMEEQSIVEKAIKNYSVMVPILDLIVGNTMVLVDRDTSNIERRKVYGKAGEHRTPEYGVEYRTLSNVWLMSYQLFGLAFGLARLAVNIVVNDSDEFSYSKALLSKVDMADVVKAINENDFDLALKNFNAIKEILLEMIGNRGHESHDCSPISYSNIKQFEYFITKPMSHWFPVDPIKHWTSLPSEIRDMGFENFLQGAVANEMKQ